MAPVFIKGFLLGASLIIAIGLQNAFVLRQGLKNRHVFFSALAASVIDVVLIALGILGFGTILDTMPGLIFWITVGGAAFLFFYGVKSLLSARRPQTLENQQARGMMKTGSLRETLLILAGVSLLNPHVWLDTVILIGGLAAAYEPPARYIFGLGAAIASFVWFFALAYGGRLLAPVFAKPKAWQILDLLIAFTMFGIALSLIWPLL